jgi:hypothetical protein
VRFCCVRPGRPRVFEKTRPYRPTNGRGASRRVWSVHFAEKHISDRTQVPIFKIADERSGSIFRFLFVGAFTAITLARQSGAGATHSSAQRAAPEGGRSSERSDLCRSGAASACRVAAAAAAPGAPPL